MAKWPTLEEVAAKAAAFLGHPRYRDINEALDRVRLLGESPRFRRLDRMEAYYRGLQHEGKTYWWDKRRYIPPEERPNQYNVAGEYPSDAAPPWPMRRPFVREQLCPAVIHRFTGLLFGAGKVPAVKAKDQAAQPFLDELMKRLQVWRWWSEARNLGGAVGSVIVGVKLRNGRPMMEVLNPKSATVLYVNNDPQGDVEVIEICYKRPVPVMTWETPKGGGQRHRVQKDGSEWYRRIITVGMDLVMTAPVDDETPDDVEWKVVEAVETGLDFVPFVVVKNTDVPGDDDGLPDCDQQWDNLDALDALRSDAFQGTHYNSDPIPVVSSDKRAHEIRTGPDSALWVGKGESVTLLEMDGSAGRSAEERANRLEDIILDNVRCILDTGPSVAKTAEEVKRRMEAMYDRADELRRQYGDGIERLMEMALRIAIQVGASGLEPLLAQHPLPKMSDVDVEWPPYVQMSPLERKTEVEKVATAVTAELVSRETGVALVAPLLGPNVNPNEELKRLAAERNERANRNPFPGLGESGLFGGYDTAREGEDTGASGSPAGAGEEEGRD